MYYGLICLKLFRAFQHSKYGYSITSCMRARRANNVRANLIDKDVIRCCTFIAVLQKPPESKRQVMLTKGCNGLIQYNNKAVLNIACKLQRKKLSRLQNFSKLKQVCTRN